MDALLLDLNGTLSNDEDVLYRVYADLFGEAGIPFSEVRYRSELLGLSDEEMFVQVLGAGADVPALLTERVRRYIAAVEQAPTVTAEVRAAVLHAAARVPPPERPSRFCWEGVLGGCGPAAVRRCYG